MRIFLTIVAIVCALPAWAEGSAHALKETGEQIFRKENCKLEPDAFFDECSCEVNIKYHEFAGQKNINAALAPEADPRVYCSTIFQKSSDEPQTVDGWKKLTKPENDKPKYEFSSVQEVTYTSGDYVAVLTQDYVFSGGAHGNTGLTSTIYNLKTDAALPISSIINMDAIPAANKAIQEQLNARKDEMFEEFVNVKDPVYIKIDGTCDACVYVLREDGLHAMFQQYAVAPYSTGIVEVKLPAELLKFTSWVNAKKEMN